MSKAQADLAQQFAQRRERNLEFFRKHYPALYTYLSKLAFTRVEVVISPYENDIDLQVNGKSMYEGKARERSQKDVDIFLEKYRPGHYLKTFAPPSPESYGIPRFSSQALKKCVGLSPLDRSGFQGYPIPKSLPFVAFLGCGLGYHIETLLKRTDIVNVLIFEPDHEVFAASLFSVDWQSICEPFIRKSGYTLTFSINKHTDDEDRLKAVLQRELLKNFPLFPAFTTFFNHRGSPVLKRLAKTVIRDYPSFAIGISNYDDQVRRLNNTIHNIKQDIPILPKRITKTIEKPVVIAGSAPSIDNRLEDIRAHRDDIILVSAGTGLRPLLSNGLKPDYHVELDPDYLIYELLSSFSAEDRAGITLLAINEVNPKVPALFDQTLLYFRSDDAYAGLFNYETLGFPNCNPTCANAAFGIFSALGFQNIFMFGTDLGFANNEYHHSKSSLYSEEETSDVGKRLQKFSKPAFSKNRLISVKSVDGSRIFTKAEFYTAKLSFENAIMRFKKATSDINIYNCSDGAEIKGSEWLSRDRFGELVRSLPDSATATEPFTHTSKLKTETAIDEIKNSHTQLKILSRNLSSALKQNKLGGTRDILALISQCTQILVKFQTKSADILKAKEQAAMARLVRGSAMHFLLIGLAHGSALPQGEAVKFARDWRQQFLEFLEELPKHFETTFTNQKDMSEDPWVTQSLWDPESEPVLKELEHQ
jgi:hypothetical protein